MALKKSEYPAISRSGNFLGFLFDLGNNVRINEFGHETFMTVSFEQVHDFNIKRKWVDYFLNDVVVTGFSCWKSTIKSCFVMVLVRKVNNFRDFFLNNLYFILNIRHKYCSFVVC